MYSAWTYPPNPVKNVVMKYSLDDGWQNWMVTIFTIYVRFQKKHTFRHDSLSNKKNMCVQIFS